MCMCMPVCVIYKHLHVSVFVCVDAYLCMDMYVSVCICESVFVCI